MNQKHFLKDKARSVPPRQFRPLGEVWIPYVWEPDSEVESFREPVPMDAPFDKKGAKRAAESYGPSFILARYVLAPKRRAKTKKRKKDRAP